VGLKIIQQGICGRVLRENLVTWLAIEQLLAVLN
jgi:hypothetical protein